MTEPVAETRPQKRLRAETWFTRWSRVLPLGVLLLVLLLGVALAAVVSHFTREQQRVRFEREVSAHTRALEQRISDFDKLLQATRAFWLANPQDITPQVFAQFSNGLGLSSRYSDVQAIGYDAWIPQGAETTLETLVASLGLPNFKVRPQTTTQDMRAPIVLIAPLTPTNVKARGFDMMSEPTRRDALERALRGREFQISGRVTLVQTAASGEPYPGFLMMLPVWRSAPVGGAASDVPATQPDGFIYLAVRADLFLQSLNSAYGAKGISSSILLDSKPLIDSPPLSGAFRADNQITLGGLNWQLNYAAPNTFGRDFFSIVPLLTLLAGLAIAGLAYQVMRWQVLARERVEATNARLVEAQVRQERARAEFEAIFQSMQDAAAFTDSEGRIRLVNRALNRQFKFRRGELSGQPLTGLHLDRNLDSALTFQSVTTPYRRSDGSVFQGESQRNEVRDQSGELLGLLEVVRDVTERVEAEQALQAEEKRSRDVLNGIPHILWVSTAEGEISYTNTQHRRRLGSFGVRDRIHPDDLAAYDQMWSDAYALGTRSQCEVRLRVGATGSMSGGNLRDRWFEIRVAPLSAEEGYVREWVASATDIHDRLVAERLAQRNEERYRGVIEGMPQIVWLTDPEGQPTYFNRRWAEYVGKERAIQGLLSTLHPDDRAEYQGRWAEAIAKGQGFEAEHRLLGADGIFRTFVTRGLPVRDASGQIIEWVGTTTDVDASVYAENASRLLAEVSTELTARVNDPLAAKAAKYAAVLDLITERFMVAASMWELPRLRVLATSRTDENWELPHLRQAVFDFVKLVASSGEVQDVLAHPLLHAVSASGGIVLPLIGLDGTMRGVVAFAYRQELHDRDQELISELTQRLASALDNDALRERAQAAQNDLRALNQSLEERVQRRTAELQEANKELEAFSYSVSHDLRTPLRHIVGFGDLLKKEAQDTLGSKGHRYLNVITDAASRMNGLIDSLLEFSRMGRQPLRATPVELRPLVEKAWQNLEPDRQGRQIVFELGGLPAIEGDAPLLDLVFQNLLSNAIKYSRTRPLAHIAVSGQQEAGYVTITVKDDGVGFDSKYTDKLFGVFQRLHRAEDFDGTGIGLANVRRIVTRHGGSVWAESVEGEGATFYVKLPLKAPGEP